MRGIIVLVFGLVLAGLAVSLFGQTKVESVKGCKVIKLQQQNIMKGKDGDMTVKLAPGRYRIDHYYDFPKNGDMVASRLTRVGDCKA